MSMEQLEEAIKALCDPRVGQEIKNQASLFTENLKTSPTGWQVCLELFVKVPKSFPEARIFGLHAVDDVLNSSFQSLSIEQVIWIRETLWNYLTQTYLVEKDDELPFLRTKLATTLAVLFRRLYLTHWESFFDDLLALLKTEQVIRSTDFFLRVLQAIDEEVVNPTIYRGRDEFNTNTNLKDKMRERDLNNLVPVWNQIIVAYQSSHPEFSIMGLGIMGEFADWIDINLVLTDTLMDILFQLIRSPKETISCLKLRNAACDCLNMIISKGMKNSEKLQLMELFGGVDLLSNIPLDDPEYIEHVAKLINRMGLEYFLVWKSADSEPELQDKSYKMLELLMPYILKFMTSEFEDTSISVFPVVNEILNLFKHQVNRKSIPLTGSQNSFLGELLKVIMSKFRYPSDYDWEEKDEEDEDSHFGSMRKSLKLYFDAINTLNKPLFDTLVHAAVTETLTTAVKPGVDWTSLELCLRMLYQYSANNNKNIVYLTDANNPSSLNHLGDMLQKMVESDILSCPHPSLAPAFYENVVRYHTFFEIRTDLIHSVLTCFLSQKGIYHESSPVRLRVWYLFLRFVKSLKGLTGRFAENILPSLAPALVIRPELPEGFNPDSPLTQLEISTSAISSQLNLFEAVGILITSSEVLSSEQKVNLLQMVLTPLITNIQNGTTQIKTANDPLFIIELHHSIMAVGSIAEGLPEPSRKETVAKPWVPLFKQSTEIILLLLEVTSQYQIIRDAARFAFSRLLTNVGAEILPYLIHLIKGLMTACTASEMLDLFPFLGLLVYKFTGELSPVMNELLGPLLDKAFVFLNESPNGTDEMVLLVNLRKAYVSFLASIFASKMEAVLCSDQNQRILPNIFGSLIHFTKDHDNPLVQKMAFNIFLKMIHAWLMLDANQDTSNQVVSPQFRDQFMEFSFQTIFPTSFEVPMLKTFDLTDGQTVLIFGEITSIHQAILRATGATFIDYLINRFLPSINCPSDKQQEFINAIQTLDARGYRKYFQEFITQSQSWIRPS